MRRKGGRSKSKDDDDEFHGSKGASGSAASRASGNRDDVGVEEEEEVARCEGATTASAAALYDQFTWEVHDLSKITEEYVYSDIFSIGGYHWRLLMYPRGNNNKSKALSVYLCVPDFQNLDPGWSRLAHFTLAVVNQKEATKTHSCDGSNKFRKREHDWGFQSLMELSKLHDATNGFLVEDKIVLQAKVQVVSHLYMPMSAQYRKELCQRHYKCALRFYFEEFLEEKLEEFEEFWEDNSDEFLEFWTDLAPPRRAQLLHVARDILLRKIRGRLFSEKHVDCNLALDVLYNAAEELRLQADGSSVAVAKTGGGAASGALFGVELYIVTGDVVMTDNGDFPDALQQARRETLRIVKETLAIKKKNPSDPVESDDMKVQKLEEIGRRMFHVFAMELVFNEHLLSAYREKIARVRQEELIREEEDEKRRDGERKAAKREKKAKKKAQKAQHKQDDKPSETLELSNENSPQTKPLPPPDDVPTRGLSATVSQTADKQPKPKAPSEVKPRVDGRDSREAKEQDRAGVASGHGSGSGCSGTGRGSGAGSGSGGGPGALSVAGVGADVGGVRGAGVGVSPSRVGDGIGVSGVGGGSASGGVSRTGGPPPSTIVAHAASNTNVNGAVPSVGDKRRKKKGKDPSASSDSDLSSPRTAGAAAAGLDELAVPAEPVEWTPVGKGGRAVKPPTPFVPVVKPTSAAANSQAQVQVAQPAVASVIKAPVGPASPVQAKAPSLAQSKGPAVAAKRPESSSVEDPVANGPSPPTAVPVAMASPGGANGRPDVSLVLGCVAGSCSQCLRSKTLQFRRKDLALLTKAVIPHATLFIIDFDTSLLHGIFDLTALVDLEAKQARQPQKQQRPLPLPIQVSFDLVRACPPLSRPEWEPLLDAPISRASPAVRLSLQSRTRLTAAFARERRASVPPGRGMVMPQSIARPQASGSVITPGPAAVSTAAPGPAVGAVARPTSAAAVVAGKASGSAIRVQQSQSQLPTDQKRFREATSVRDPPQAQQPPQVQVQARPVERAPQTTQAVQPAGAPTPATAASAAPRQQAAQQAAAGNLASSASSISMSHPEAAASSGDLAGDGDGEEIYSSAQLLAAVRADFLGSGNSKVPLFSFNGFQEDDAPPPPPPPPPPQSQQPPQTQQTTQPLDSSLAPVPSSRQGWGDAYGSGAYSQSAPQQQYFDSVMAKPMNVQLQMQQQQQLLGASPHSYLSTLEGSGYNGYDANTFDGAAFDATAYDPNGFNGSAGEYDAGQYEGGVSYDGYEGMPDFLMGGDFGGAYAAQCGAGSQGFSYGLVGPGAWGGAGGYGMFMGGDPNMSSLGMNAPPQAFFSMGQQGQHLGGGLEGAGGYTTHMQGTDPHGSTRYGSQFSDYSSEGRRQ